jgi:hypothetical protein
MPTKFPTEAANADFLGEDPDDKRGTSEPPLIGADGTPRGRADGTPEPPDEIREQRRSDEKPNPKDSAEP